MTPDQQYGKRIAYACFDWGFGHVTRSVVLLDRLIRQQNEVFFFGNKTQLTFVRSYVPGVQCIEWDVPPLHFFGTGNFKLEGLRNYAHIRKIWKMERETLLEAQRQYSFDLTISDHRYHFRIPGISSVFLTHQFELPPGTSWWIQRIHARKRKGFDQVWVPDFIPGKLAGKLSQNAPESSCIGLLSRFQLSEPAQEDETILLVLTGPKPYAEQFLKLTETLWKNNPKVRILAGFSQPDGYAETANWIEQGNLSQQQSDQLFWNARLVISRFGYSTYMDLIHLEKRGVLLATAGQTEQEYLADLNQYPLIYGFKDADLFLKKARYLLDSDSSGSD